MSERDSGAIIRVALVAAAEGLMQLLGRRQGLLTHQLEDSGEVVSQAAPDRVAFERRVSDTIRRLEYEYGAKADPELTRRAGVDPETLLGPPPRSATESDMVTFAVWRIQDASLFVAGRHYTRGDRSRALLLLGLAREGTELAAEKLT